MAGFDDLNDSLDGTPEESDGSDESEASEGSVGPTGRTDESDRTGVAEQSDSSGGQSGLGGFDPSELPYKYRRETVKDDRSRVDLFVLGETEELETEAVRGIEDRVGGGVSLIDAREAIYRAGMRNLGDALAELEGWGYESE